MRYLAINYSRLKGRIVEKFGNQKNFAKAMNWSEKTLSKKINGDVFWRQTDICKALRLLDLTVNDVQEYFFETEVQSI